MLTRFRVFIGFFVGGKCGKKGSSGVQGFGVVGFRALGCWVVYLGLSGFGPGLRLRDWDMWMLIWGVGLTVDSSETLNPENLNP